MITFKALGNYGHLGNQMFQIATTVALALRYNDKYVFPSWKYESFFNLHNCYSNNIVTSNEYNEPAFHYNEIPYKPNMNINGYFQSANYFNDFENEIRKFFTPKQEVPFQKGVASIHVRRTDYLNFPEHHPVPSMSYYESAMEQVGVNKFVVFSDDIAWCKQHFVGNQFEFSEGQHEVIDLVLQSKCEHNITANSSFSFWAAWLNNNIKKTVIMPKIWFGPALSMHNTKDLYPKGTIII